MSMLLRRDGCYQLDPQIEEPSGRRVKVAGKTKWTGAWKYQVHPYRFVLAGRNWL